MVTMKRYTLSLFFPLLLMACQSGPEADTSALSPYEGYGEQITDEGAVPVQAVVAESETFVGQTVKVEGTVAEVCQERGCWLTLRAGDDTLVRVVVPRTESGDYVYTVPKNISGRRVVVEGTLDEARLSEHEQHHMAEAAGETVEADADALPPKPELHLTARGVLVEKANT
jgi:hypothetical protein